MDAFEDLEIKEQNDPSVVLFVGLYLLLLAFFVLLNVISTLDEQRAKTVLDSLTATFSSDFGPLSSRPVYSSDVEAPLVSNRFLSDVEQLFENAMPVAQFDILVHGNLLEVLLVADEIFVPGKVDIRPEYEALFFKLQDILTFGPAGLRYDMGIMIDGPSMLRKNAASGQTMEMARVGSIARRMVALGTVPAYLYAGIDDSNLGRLRLLFRVRSENGDEVLFRKSDG